MEWKMEPRMMECGKRNESSMASTGHRSFELSNIVHDIDNALYCGNYDHLMKVLQ